MFLVCSSSGMGATGHTVGGPQTDDHQKRGDEPKHRSSDQRWHASCLDRSDNGGDEEEHGAHTIMEELREGAVDAGCPGVDFEDVDEEED